MRSNFWCLAGTLVFGITAACSGGGDSSPGEPDPVIAKTSSGSGDGQTAGVTEALTQDLRVIVTLNGQPVDGADVTWSVSANGGSIAPATATTGADGIALGEWTFGTKSGAFTATATLAGASGSPVSFSATAQPDVAFQFSLAAGNTQTGDVGTPFSEPLAVRLEDQYDNPIAGQNVGWSVTSGPATVGATSATGANGVATINAFYGATAGAIVIQATPPNALPPVNFNATALALPTAITIQVQNNSFSPRVDTVAAGGTVRWNWAGSDHDVTSNPAGLLDSGIHSAGFSYGPIAFPAAGTYNYECTQHPPGMVGTIVVRL